jgi:hypothetical protein
VSDVDLLWLKKLTDLADTATITIYADPGLGIPG